MLIWFLIGLLLLAATVLLLRLFIAADPKKLARAIVWIASGILGALFLYLAVSGRLSWLFVAIPVVLPWVFRARMLARAFKTFSRARGTSTGRATGQASRVETRYLRMTLDHDSGHMDGEVIQGNWAGRKLSDMDRIALIALLVYLNEVDGQSASLLVAYLDREQPGWKEGAEGQTAGTKAADGTESEGFSSGTMSRDEALRILGLEEGADEAAIKAAHRRLMALMHPDRGGSSYLAAKINQARDTLL
jgi:membrane protein implicated in regulation of membrane protease activity